MEIQKYCPEVEVTTTYSDSRKALADLKENTPDLVFLDIEMPHLNGFELLQRLAKIDFDVIFVTAYDEYAVKAFEFNAVDYLLKPILKTKLRQAVQKVSDKRATPKSRSSRRCRRW
jgi:two-component system LytT family response regulator